MNHKFFLLLIGIGAISILSYQQAWAVTVYPGTIISNPKTNYTADTSPNFNVTSITTTPTHIYLGTKYFDLNYTLGQVKANVTQFVENNNMTLHLTSSFGNVHLFVLGQVKQVKLGTTFQQYGTSWQYVLANTVTDITVAANHDVFISFNGTSPTLPYVTDLHYTTISNNQINLAWSTPDLTGFTFSGYQINYTTPFGTPLTIIIANTTSSATTYTISGLSNNTAYSFRVGTIANGTVYAQFSNILDATTLTAGTPNLTPGQLNLNVGTNPNRFPFAFYRTDTGATTMDLYVSYPITYNTTCNFNYQLANTNQSYYNLPTFPNGTNRVKSLFQFSGVGNDDVNIICKDVKTNDTGHFVITQTIDSIPLVQQVHQFENGAFGTAGQFGAFDLIELIVIILSMIALNRVDQKVGAIIMVIVLLALGFFHIGSLPVIIFSAIAMVLVLVVANRKAAG
jgi:hypothetical protein